MHRRGRNTSMGKLFVVMGKSATGKDTIYKYLIKQDKVSFKKIVPYTTRPIREGEQHGVQYFFVSYSKMKELIAQRKVIEKRVYHTVHGDWYYFTADDGQIDIRQNSNYLMITTPEAYGYLREYFGAEGVKPIYIEVEAGLRLERALKREREQASPKYAEMCRRFLADEEDFSEEKLKNLGIKKYYKNENIDNCLENIIDDILNGI